ncbi:MAG: hypothetical protein ABSD31_09055 [Candidatus Binataceae bacterium]|jgi:hypothetical protein
MAKPRKIDADQILAEARTLTVAYKRGDDNSAASLCELFNLLLRSTIMARGNALRVYQGPRRNAYLLGSQSGQMAPVQLRDGRFLDVRMGLTIHGTQDGWRLKVMNSVFQYQVTATGDDWIFRYEGHLG